MQKKEPAIPLSILEKKRDLLSAKYLATLDSDAPEEECAFLLGKVTILEELIDLLKD